MTDHDVIALLRAKQNGPTLIVACTLYGEARGVGDAERAGMACTILNRVKAKRWGLTADAVCLMPWQYSCWTPSGGVANYELVMDLVRQLLRDADPATGPALRACLTLAASVVDGSLPDTTSDSTHYMTRALYATRPPTWTHGLTPACQIGGTVFFNHVP